MARGLFHPGAQAGDAFQDQYDVDAFSAPPTLFTGTADVINPHVAANIVIKSGSADAMTLAAPTAGVDDFLSLQIWSDTLFAHTITATSLFANGTALKTTATFAAFRGAGISLRAFNGVWQVIGNTAVTLT